MSSFVAPRPRLLPAAPVAAGAGLGLVSALDPGLALVVALGAGFALVSAADLTLGLCLFTLVTFLATLPANAELLSFTKLAGLLLALSWLMTVIGRRDAGRGLISRHPGVAYVLLLFVAWGALSLLWAESLDQGAASVSRYGFNALLFAIVPTAIRAPRHALLLVAAFVAGTVISVSYGMAARSDASISVDGLSRLTGTSGDPNELAAVLVAGLVLAGGLAIAAKGLGLARLAAIAAVCLCTVGIFLTASRGGLLTLAFALGAGLLVGGRWRRLVAIVAVALASSALIYFAVIASPEIRSEVVRVEGASGRLDLWTVGLRMIEDNPVHGVGVGNFPTSAIHYLLEPGTIEHHNLIVDTPQVAHNAYLEVLAELGLVGLVLFVSVLAFSVVCALRAARAFERQGDRRMEAVTRAVLVALLGILASSFFISGQFEKQLWLLLGAGPALLAIARSGVPAARPPVSARHVPPSPPAGGLSRSPRPDIAAHPRS
jgi:O-antigen ligase